MTHESFARQLSGKPAENYERYFVPAIGAPLAEDLLEAAALRPGERVLDVACGTGVIARGAVTRVGPSGNAAGVDVNPAMLAMARSAAPPGGSIRWYETSAEAMPLADEGFDVVLCQMGLQFFADRAAALRQARRVLAAEGRLLLNVPGPTPPLFEVLAECLARHVGPESAPFVHRVFSLHDPDELRELVEGAGFREVSVRSVTKALRLPPPEKFLWQYLYSTPLADAVRQADEDRWAALERDVCASWRKLVVEDALLLRVRVTTVTAVK